MSSDLLTTREAAALLGVGTTSVKRWADAGLLRCVKTPGGHRRFPREAVGEFIRTHGEPSAIGDRVSDWLAQLTGTADVSSDLSALRREREAHGSWWQTADAMAPVLTELGRQWEVGDLTVLQEHVASERLARAVARCAEALPLTANAPCALLLAAQGDDHTLGLSFVELCLREAGWRTMWAGRRTPLAQAIELLGTGRVELIAVSASSYSTDADGLAMQAERLAAACEEHDATLLLGGQGLWPAEPAYGYRMRDFRGLHELLATRRAR